MADDFTNQVSCLTTPQVFPLHYFAWKASPLPRDFLYKSPRILSFAEVFTAESSPDVIYHDFKVVQPDTQRLEGRLFFSLSYFLSF
ncbi:hypothetical protein GCM10022205_37320 [Spinactinospora alkalitolerans]